MMSVCHHRIHFVCMMLSFTLHFLLLAIKDLLVALHCTSYTLLSLLTCAPLYSGDSSVFRKREVQLAVNLVSKLSSYTPADAATFTEKTRAECAELSGRATDGQLNASHHLHHLSSIIITTHPSLLFSFFSSFCLSPSILHISPLALTLPLPLP